MTAVIESKKISCSWAGRGLTALLAAGLAIAIALPCGLQYLRHLQLQEALTFLSQMQTIMGRHHQESGAFGTEGECAEAMPQSLDLSFDYACHVSTDGQAYRMVAIGKPSSWIAGLEVAVTESDATPMVCDDCRGAIFSASESASGWRS